MKTTQSFAKQIALGAGLAAAVFLATPSHVAAQQLINVDFGAAGQVVYSGPGPIIGAAGDFWNSVTNENGWVTTSAGPLNDSSNVGTTVSLFIGGMSENWVNYSSSMPEPYGALIQEAVSWWGDDTIVLSGLDDSKTYDLYLINGPFVGDNGAFTVNGVTRTYLGTATTALPWVEGDQYVRFIGLPTDGLGQIAISLSANTAPPTRMSGLQLYVEPPQVTIVSHPIDVSAAPGGTATLSAMASGGTGSPTYQWQEYVGGTFVNLSDGNNLWGSTSNVLTITNITAGQAGVYHVIATAGTSVTSSNATITVLGNPGTAISLNPAITITNGTVGFHYQVQYSSNPNGPTWTLLQNIPSLPSNPYAVYDPAAATLPQRYYRAVVLP
jgi:hypothetical protein